MGIVLLWATWAHEYMAILKKMYGHRTEFGQHVNKMMSVAVNNFLNF